MEKYIQLIAAFFGSAGFAMAYNFREKKQILLAGFGGFAGWLCYLIVHHITGNDFAAGFAGTLLVSFYSEAAARILKTPATGLLIVTSIPMIPGASLYRCMQHLVRSETELFRQRATYTILFASCMAAGFVAARIIVHLVQTAGDAQVTGR